MHKANILGRSSVQAGAVLKVLSLEPFAFAMFFCKRCAGLQPATNHTPKSRAVLLSSTAPLFTNPYLPVMNPDASTSLCAC